MTIYVDDMRLQARVGTINARWSHLYSDTSDEELHAFAELIGLKRSWFQQHRSKKPNHPMNHYDVTDTKRNHAIRCGATAISWENAGEEMAKRVRAFNRKSRP